MKKLLFLFGFICFNALYINAQDAIIHDAEYYIIEAQNGEKWAAEWHTQSRQEKLPIEGAQFDTKEMDIDLFSPTNPQHWLTRTVVQLKE